MGMKWEPGLGYQGGASDEFDVGPSGKHVPYMVPNHRGEMVHNPNYHRDMGHKSTPKKSTAPASSRHYHAVPFAKKDEAKHEGMTFDWDKKKWYHSDEAKSKSSAFKKLNESTDQFLMEDAESVRKSIGVSMLRLQRARHEKHDAPSDGKSQFDATIKAITNHIAEMREYLQKIAPSKINESTTFEDFLEGDKYTTV